MSNKKEQKPRKNTPKGMIMWAHLKEPKVYTDPETGIDGPPKYTCDVAFDPASDREWKEWMDDIETRSEKAKFRNRPFREEMGEDGPTGRFLAKFSTHATDKEGRPKPPPPIYDGKKNNISEDPRLIGNGSLGRINYTESSYKGMGGGFNFYLNAVQILKFEEYVRTAPPAEAFEFGDDGEELPPAEEEEKEDLPF